MHTSFHQRLPKTDQLFIPFIVAGDPSPELTIELALKLQEAGASILELGIPYSDPLADGPVIQQASARALKHNTSLESAMNLVPLMRERGLKIPVIIFTYYNPVLQLGEERFFALAKENGIDGLLIPDLPFEESEQIRVRSLQEGLQFISLVAPTSAKRIQQIASRAQGFLYCVSSLGVTGSRNTFHENIYQFLAEVKELSSVPVAVGFGVSSYEHVKQFEGHCDGVVIGSAIVKKIERLQSQLLDPDTRDNALHQFKKEVEAIISPITI